MCSGVRPQESRESWCVPALSTKCAATGKMKGCLVEVIGRAFDIWTILNKRLKEVASSLFEEQWLRKLADDVNVEVVWEETNSKLQK